MWLATLVQAHSLTVSSSQLFLSGLCQLTPPYRVPSSSFPYLPHKAHSWASRCHLFCQFAASHTTAPCTVHHLPGWLSTQSLLTSCPMPVGPGGPGRESKERVPVSLSPASLGRALLPGQSSPCLSPGNSAFFSVSEISSRSGKPEAKPHRSAQSDFCFALGKLRVLWVRRAKVSSE